MIKSDGVYAEVEENYNAGKISQSIMIFLLFLEKNKNNNIRLR